MARWNGCQMERGAFFDGPSIIRSGIPLVFVCVALYGRQLRPIPERHTPLFFFVQKIS